MVGKHVRVEKIVDHPEPDFLAVFVHGLSGCPRETWRNRGTGFFWPKELPFPKYRALSIGYDAPMFVRKDSQDFDLEKVACGILRVIEGELKALLFTSTNSREIHAAIPLIFICHSLGGVVVKRVIEKAYSDPDQPIGLLRLCQKAVVFIGTPHLGSSLASLVFAITPRRYRSQTIAVLASRHPIARMINSDFASTSSIHRIRCLALAELSKFAGILHVAPVESLLHRITSIKLVQIFVRDHHVSIVKPRNKDGAIIAEVVDLIRQMLSQQGRRIVSSFSLVPAHSNTNYKPNPSTIDESAGYQFMGVFELESRIACEITKIELIVERDGHFAICVNPGKSYLYFLSFSDDPGVHGFVSIGGEKRYLDSSGRFRQAVNIVPEKTETLSISCWCCAIGMSRNIPETKSIGYWIDDPTLIVQISYRYGGHRYSEFHRFGYENNKMVLRGINFQWLDRKFYANTEMN